MKYFSALLLIFIFTKGFAQEAYVDIPNSLKTGKKKTQGVFTLVNDKDGTFAVFMDDDNGLNGYLYTSEGTEISKFNSKGLPSKYNAIVGYTVDANVIRLFLKNKNNRTFGSIMFNFDTGTTSENEFDIKLKNERYVQSFRKDEKFYIVTIKEKSSTFHFYRFMHDGNFKKSEYSLENKTFRNKHNRQVSLYELMTEKISPADDFHVKMIYPGLPTSIQTTRALLKMYPAPKGVILTIDKSPSLTYYVTFDIHSSIVQLDGFLKPLLTKTSEYNRSNSFVSKGILFQVIANPKELAFEAKNISTKQKLTSQHTFKNEHITYKNSPYYGFSSTIVSDDDSSKFLNRAGSSSIGILAMPQEDGGYQVTLGSFDFDYHQKRMNKSAVPVGAGVFGGLVGGLIAAAINSSLSPPSVAFAAYSNQFVFRVECLFDKNMNHKRGVIKMNVFDRIKHHIPAKEKRPIENVFHLKDTYHYGYYDLENDIFKIASFSKEVD